MANPSEASRSGVMDVPLFDAHCDEFPDSSLFEHFLGAYAGKERFMCSICDKAFSKAGALKSHMKVHAKDHIMSTHSTENTLSCYVCGRKFRKKADLKRHVVTHSGEKPFVCDACPWKFSTQRNLDRHAKTHYERDKPHKCYTCGARFTESSYLKTHMKIHTVGLYGGKQFACCQCDYKSMRANNLKAHVLRTHSVQKPFTCEFCGRGYGAKADMTNHVMTHTGERPFACALCDFKCIKATALKVHTMRMHTGEKSFLHDSCPKRFNARGDLERHVKIQTETEKLHVCFMGEDPSSGEVSAAQLQIGEVMANPSEASGSGVMDVPLFDAHCEEFPDSSLFEHFLGACAGKERFMCSICDKAFSKAGALKSHMKVHAKDLIVSTHSTENTLSCYVCGREFRKKTDLKRHVVTHSGEKPFACDTCPWKFSTQRDLDRHAKTHYERDKPHKCYTCGARFTERSYLKTHMKIHTVGLYGEKRFACSQCDYKSMRANNLKAHVLRTHSVQKPFTCEICGRGYGAKADLTNHVMTHTGERPFACELCDFKCIKANALKVHTMRVHTGEKPFLCDSCPKRFSARGDLERHVKIHTETEKLHVCEFCGARFAQAGYLETHLKTIHGEKKDMKFACAECDFKCRRADKLNHHIVRIHSQQRPFSCAVCSRTFSLEKDLRRHAKTHTESKSHACDICDLRFRQPGQLKVHMRTHTGEKPYSCNLCGFKCGRVNNLKMHISRVHKEVTSSHEEAND